MNSPMSLVAIGRGFLFLAMILLVSCADSGVGSGGSGVPAGVQSGTVNGFGSVIVDSTVYQDDNASVSIDLDGETAPSLTTDDIRLGMQIRLAFEQEGVAQSVEIDPQVIGSVESVGSNQLVVAGQTVSIVSRGARPTVFGGFDQLSALRPGDRVMVFGLFGEFGRLFATRIQLGAPGPQTLVKVTGAINSIGLLRRSLRIGDQVITFTRETPIDVTPSDIRLGDLVSVWANATESDVIEARRIALRDARPSVGTVRRFIGFVRQAPVNGIAVIGRKRVDISTATFLNGSETDLTPGRLVLVGAQVVEGQLQADSITVLDLARESVVSVAGTVRVLSSGVSLEVRNTRVDLSSSELTFVGGSAADLVDGAQVLVRGFIIDGRLLAAQIEFAN